MWDDLLEGEELSYLTTEPPRASRSVPLPAELHPAVRAALARQGIDDLYYSSLGSRYNGPEDVSIVTTGQIWDQTHWSTDTENGPKFGALYKQLSQTVDDKEQHNIVNQMLKLFHEETVWMPLWILPVAAGVNKRITWQDTGAGNRMELWPTGQDPFKVES